MFRIRALVLVAAVFTTPLAAQAPQASSAPMASGAVVGGGPRVELTATAAHHVASATSQPTPAQRKNMGQPVALMVVGGAAVLLGAIVGGDVGTVIMVGGVVAFLIGLYEYVQ